MCGEISLIVVTSLTENCQPPTPNHQTSTLPPSPPVCHFTETIRKDEYEMCGKISLIVVTSLLEQQLITEL